MKTILTLLVLAAACSAQVSNPSGGGVINNPGGAGGGTPAGLSLSFQYNNVGSFGGSTVGTNRGTYVFGRVNTSQGTAATPSEIQLGDCLAPGNIKAATATYTVAYTDALNCNVVHDILASVPATITIPTPATLNNPAPVFTYSNYSSQADTLSPTTYTIGLGNVAAVSTLTVPTGVSCKVQLDPANASTWKADCHKISTSGSPGTINPVYNITDYGCVGDDSTDNATCFTNANAAVNAYVGPGIPTLYCEMGPGDKAYKTTIGLLFNIPVEVRGGCTIDYSGVGDVIRLGPTGLVSFLTAQYKSYTVKGLTFVGGASMTYGIHVPGYIPQIRIMDNTFFNFGASTNWMVHLDGPNPEVEISRNVVFANDSVAGRNAFYNFDSAAIGSNTLRFLDNHVSNSSLACGGVGLYNGGYDSVIMGNTFFSYSPSIHLSTTDRGNQSGAGTRIIDNSFDDVGCTNSATAGVIQVGDTGATNTTGPIFILHNNTPSDSSGNANFVSLYPGTTSTTLNANIQGNRALTSGATGFLVKTSGSFVCACYGWDNAGWVNGNTFGAFPLGSAARPDIAIGQATTGFHGGNGNSAVDFSFNGTDAFELGQNYAWVKNVNGYAIGASSNSWMSAPISGIFTFGTAASGEQSFTRSANACRITADVSLTVNTANSFCSYSLPALAKAWAFSCDIQWAITAGSGTNTFALGVNPSQTPTGTTNAEAQIYTATTGTQTMGSAAISASGATNILTGATYTPGATVQYAKISGTLLASGTAGTFAIQATANGTTATAAVKAGSACLLY